MRTLTIIEKLLSYYKDKVSKCTKINDIECCNKELMHIICQCIEKFPHLMYPFCDSKLDKESAIELFSRIKEEVSNCFVPMFPTHLCFRDVIAGHSIETPIYCCIHEETQDGYGSINVETNKINDYLLSMLISLPINKINITFVEIGSTLIGEFFYRNVNSKLYQSIKKDSELRTYLEKLKERIISAQQLYGSYPDYCIKSQTIPMPYEVVVLPQKDKDNCHKNIYQDFEFIEVNGIKAGIHIVYLNESIQTPEIIEKSQLLSNMDIRQSLTDYGFEEFCYNELIIEKDANPETWRMRLKLFEPIKKETLDCTTSTIIEDSNVLVYRTICDSDVFDYESFLYHFTKGHVSNVCIKNLLKDASPLLRTATLMENKSLLNICLKYINKQAEKGGDALILRQDYQKIADMSYERNIDSIVVPIGKSNTEVYFRLDTISHVHSFIIGQSGSGKSVFLHNIIGNTMLKYAPEDLQIYLLDFKLGGVEFNRYKGIKHVKSLLVDNSDQQITLEILREIREQMVERGKKLRDAGVSNIVEYNKLNPQSTMPRMLLIVDECHEMFNTYGNTPRMISNEIAEIVTKIAKEGRSQGVHLIMATQTLSGTEISNEILNNISDHYLLKCATTDSERLVERSSETTSKLTTGQIFYHHVDGEATFQSYYIDKASATLQIEEIKKKSEGHASNETFYFNGLQLFHLDETLSKNRERKHRYPLAYIGKNISIKLDDLSISLKKDSSENILLFGLNEQEQVTRTTMNVFLSLLYNIKSQGRDCSIKVINCLVGEESKYSEQLEALEEKGYCEIIEGKKARSQYLRQLAEDVVNEKAEETILLILGQERFRELKMDMEFEDDSPKLENGFGFGDLSFSNASSDTSINSFRQALNVILDKGSEQGVHVIMQLDKPSNFLFSDYVTSKMVYQKFKHLIMLKSDDAAAVQLHLNDNIRLETLSKDLERLRAYYYSDESDSYALFTPYVDLEKDEIINLLESM